MQQLRMRLDRLINKLCEIRNTTTLHDDVDFDIAHELAETEVAVEALAQEIDLEVKEL
jgi:hypothetical protein